MRCFVRLGVVFCLIALSALPSKLAAQQAPDTFRWIDFHSPKDQDVVVWVTRALEAQNWTAIREIGVQYDAALVVTTLRATPQSTPNQDTFQVWSVSLTNHLLTPLLKGVNLRFVDWMLFAQGRPRELAATYDDCSECAASTFFTAFFYDIRQHTWAARWMRAGQAATIWIANPPPGVTQTQVYAAMAEPDGRDLMATWRHLDYGKVQEPQDFVYRYDLDPFGSIERMQLIYGKDAEALKQRLCRVTDPISGLARGQDSALCQPVQKPARFERRPVTTPPANNRGHSSPPGAKH
jgi:hypothetical protein